MLSSVKLTLATCYRSRLAKRTGRKYYEHRAIAEWKLAVRYYPEKSSIMSTATTILRISGSSAARERT